ncbi:hypothetical protein [Agromyces archimandritae]|uniref:Flagellar protein FlgN n=1 Tax=Agromyces archimandritae TaxID=2781962 RepID=A0A975FN62_9MICO|nr:hypothetical protein [Agromyces archimandritae]QTX05505.1 hypothetical protein G127AT_04620 [Agromyces archimandritae]
MSDGVEIPLASMEELNTAIKQIVVEFEDAGKRTDALVDAIGRPFGRGELRDAADEFEGAWDDKRDTLKGHLVELQEQVEGVKDAWKDFDVQLAAEIEQKEG